MNGIRFAGMFVVAWLAGAKGGLATFDAVPPQPAVSNVVSVGADPLGKQDSADAFQRALDGGGEIDVPPGTYLIGKKISMTKPGTSLNGHTGSVLSFPAGYWRVN